MTPRLPLLTDDEVARGRPAGDEAGIGTLTTQRGNLPLEAVDVAASITGLVARTVLTQTFGNPLGQPLEATYIFPLPDRAAVTEFRMEIGERVVEGVLQERGQARESYDRAIREGRRASIAEEERPGVFTMRVGNLQPGERVRVRLVMTGPLPWDEGEATYRFPLVVAPRYIPGAPLDGPSVGDGTVPDTDEVPDASRITPPVLLPGFPNPVRLSIAVEIDPAGLELDELRSSLHAVVEERRDGPEGLRLVRVEPGERANRDFVLRLRTGSAAVATSLMAVPDREGDAGSFALTLLPPEGGLQVAPPREVAFVLDRSGSMRGWKMVAARRAVARMVDTLGERDRFLLLAFDNLVESPPDLGDGLQPATDRARFRAVEFLSRLEARGGTEMAAPLTLALQRLAEPPDEDGEPPARLLVLVTDGQVGNEEQLLRLLAPHLGAVRVYTVGVDSAVNEGFLKRLAGLGGGACELVESEDRLDQVMDRVHRRIGAPAVTDLELDAGGLGVDLESIAPRRLPALFAGAPLMICGRYAGPPGGALTVRGLDAAGQPWSARVPAVTTAAPAVTSVWARAHLRDLEDRYASEQRADRDLERRIVETSLRFGVLCRFTAFVAADVEVVERGGTVHRVVQPVEPPAGWDMFERAELAAMPLARMATRPTGGLLSVGPELGQPAGDLGHAAGPLGKVAGRFRAGQGGPRLPRLGGSRLHPLGGEELVPYRRRAHELARLLEREGPELAGHLRLVRVGLAALVADLESVDAVEAELRPLRDLAAALDRLDGADPPAAELARLRRRVLAGLEAFAGAAPSEPASAPTPAPQPPSGRPTAFWKR